MKHQIVWTKKQQEFAAEKNRGLYAYGFDTKSGRWEQSGLMDDGLAHALFFFVNAIYRGSTPQEAFEGTVWPD